MSIKKLIGLLLFLTVTSSLPAQDTDDSFQDEEMDTVTTTDFLNRQPVDSFHLVQRNIPADKISKLKQDEAFWYADKDFADKKKPPEQEKLTNPYIPLAKRPWFQTLLWLVIIGGFTAALTWFLAGARSGLFRKKKKADIATGDGQLISEDIFSIAYQTEIDKAVQQGNYRLATRLLYLRILKELDERNIIQYQHDKPNLHYLRQLQPTSYYDMFFRITQHYEYAWYGLFEIDPGTYQSIKKDFEKFERMLN